MAKVYLWRILAVKGQRLPLLVNAGLALEAGVCSIFKVSYKIFNVTDAVIQPLY